MIDYCQTEGKHSYILIDVGKTFREQVLRWFSLYKIPRVDSIILTHEHADAVLGLDDIRAIQPHSPTNNIDPTPIYLTRHPGLNYTCIETEVKILTLKNI
uniref:Metallo-beta-lactamase domain-containing protein n=1 Tax=Cannabis sativa TaxID=3483 RepID=A0A803NNV9_CANSA